MEFSKETQSKYVTLGYIVLGAASRFMPHPPNVTPIAAMALLGGAYLPRKQAFLLPLAALFASDLLLGFHSTMPFVYGSFLATAWIGSRLRRTGRDSAPSTAREVLLLTRGNRTAWTVAGASVASSILFFLVTNAGVWWTQDLYPRTAAGLSACYIAAMPFFRNSALGDLWFTAVLFGLEGVSLGVLRERRSAVSIGTN